MLGRTDDANKEYGTRTCNPAVNERARRVHRYPFISITIEHFANIGVVMRRDDVQSGINTDAVCGRPL